MNVASAQTAETRTENLAGLVERVTFHNEENGFCVLRLKARGQRDLITVIGHAAMISAGEWVQAAGTWTNDRTHGLQFRASFLKATPPTTLDGIERYLGSGMIRGIGPAYAKRLVKSFGETIFEVIEADPDRLREVEGIGPVRAERIAAGWAEQNVVREIMLFLHAHGVGTSRAVRIYKTYGAEAVAIISDNPYRLRIASFENVPECEQAPNRDPAGIRPTALIGYRKAPQGWGPDRRRPGPHLSATSPFKINLLHPFFERGPGSALIYTNVASATPNSFVSTNRRHWFNTRRLLEPIGKVPPAEAEARYYAKTEVQPLAG